MHIALIVDEDRLVRERPALNRLSIGLIGEGVQLTRIIPDSFASESPDEGEQRIALAARVTTPMHVLPWMRRDRASRIAEAMDKGPPDVLYALGQEAWALGRDLAKTLERPLAIDVWSAGQTRRAPRGRAAAAVAGYIAPTPPIAEALRARVDPALVCVVPVGVALPPQPRTILSDPEKSATLAIIGGGRDVPAYRDLLAGLSRVVRKRPQVHAFLELSGPNEHEIWRHAQRLDLLEHVSAITDASQHRALLTRCDMLLVPERFGELRTLMLEAMAFGMPVIAGADPFLDMLVDGESASVVKEPAPDEWARHMERLLSDPATARTLGGGGRERMATYHRSSDQVTALVDACQRMISGGTYPFP